MSAPTPHATPCSLIAQADIDWVEQLLAHTGNTPDRLIPLLQAVQEHYRWLPPGVLEYLCAHSSITPAAVAGVSTFYSSFRHRPAGRHSVKVCIGTACHVKGAQHVYDALIRHLECAEGEDTDPQGLFTVEKVACLGCCTLAPAVQIDTVTYGHVTPAGAADMLRNFLQTQSQSPSKTMTSETSCSDSSVEIRLSLGSCCVANGTARVGEAVAQTLAELGVTVPVKSVGCLGVCHQAPVLEIAVGGTTTARYSHVTPGQVRPVLRRHFQPQGKHRQIGAWIADRAEALLRSPQTPDQSMGRRGDCGDGPVERYLQSQHHIATEHCGTVGPTDIDDYIRHGGFEALQSCLDSLQPEQIIDVVARSGLRGRGGGGYPTGRKWEQVRAAGAGGGPVYVICNGDEGDPGAFMDRKLLESYPYRIIEGVLIAARAVGASEGVLYVRSEYPLALARVREALQRCFDCGYLGASVRGTPFAFTLRIMEGAGAFVCGEETALIRSIEGARGMPRPRPPYPAEHGLLGAPTLINNCETFACIPWIVRNGPRRFAATGTPRSSGTKVFSLAGKIRYGGLIEVPMGMTIRDIVETIGGGMAGDVRFKAVQIGGPSGGCIPAECADTSIDFEALTEAGAMMGSGGIVVMDERDCMVDIARYFLSFTQEQSCGRCTFCRIGTRRMLDILEALCEGRARTNDVERLEELALQVSAASLCGLGKTAPNPVATTLRYFRAEYEAHLRGECPAGKCKPLISYTIDQRCDGCTICAQSCPVSAIPFTPYRTHSIDQTRCIRCDTCRHLCPVSAIGICSPAITGEAPCPP